MNTLRNGLPALPDHMRALPVDARGYPIPWFVKWIDGKPDFRVLDDEKFKKSVRFNLCHVCGNKLGRHRSFIGGPMATLQRISGEPPMHLDCALFAVKACPFMLMPRSKRRTANLPDELTGITPPGIEIVDENPGISCIWTCSLYTINRDRGVFEFRSLVSEHWFTEGREATQDEITAALNDARQKLAERLSKPSEVPS